MKSLFLVSAMMMACLTSPASGNPILYALNEQPKCMENVENSNVLRHQGMRKVGSNGVRLKIKKNKEVKASGKEFNRAKAAYLACMARRLEPHSVVLK